MEPKTKAFYVFWISKLGRKKVSAEFEGLDAAAKKSVPPKVRDLAQAIVSSYESDVERLDRLVLQGFQGQFHQHVYLRRIDQGTAQRVKILKELPLGEKLDRSVCETP